MERLLLFSHPVMFYSLWPHGLQHTRPPCPSLSPEVCPSSCPLHQWCHPAISSSDALLSLPSVFPSIGTFPVSWLFASGDQNIGASASAAILPMSTQGSFPFRLTGLIFLLSKALSGKTTKLEIWVSEFNGDSIGGGLGMAIWILRL